jgi:hypothetical protein
MKRIPTGRRMPGGGGERRGTVLVVALIAVMVLAGLSASMVLYSGAVQRENRTQAQSTRALYVAEAGLARGIDSVRAGVVAGAGSSAAPVEFSGGGYWYTIVDNGDETMTVTSFAEVANETRATQAILEHEGEGIYTHALFAGNSNGDPLYELKFGGLATQADRITGNIYSGNDVLIQGDASVSGRIRAAGQITGGTGTEGVRVPTPDIAGMNYAANHDYDVGALFASATYKSNAALGGSAWQVAESNPAHIFRRNPSDRSSAVSSTAKDDYFLEDPYETVSTSNVVSPASGTHITLSGQDGNPGSSGTQKVYYIDGNLWIHNNNIYSFTLFNAGVEPIQVTFVVKGNIYISDNILYQGGRPDGLALIAIKDSAVADSGNILFGDPSFGTLERMDSFMYAEDDFVDNNLSASGSATVTVNGNMTAGDQVRINRDWGSQHSKLTVNFDDRISTGAITLPGLPKSSGAGDQWTVVSWREIAAP